MGPPRGLTTNEHGYLLGLLGPGPIQSTALRSWLPDASPPSTDGTVGKSLGQRHFLTGEPTGSSARASESGPARPNVSLDALKELIAENKRQLAAGDGSREYSKCLAWTLWENRLYGMEDVHEFGTIGSGLPAGTEVVATQPIIDYNLQRYGDVKPEDYPSHLTWFEGPAGHLVEDLYPGYVVTTRPLPAGQYIAYGKGRSEEMVICEGKRTVSSVINMTVTAPAGTLAEAFFDPVADGSAIATTTTIGTFSYQDNTIRVDLSSSANGVPGSPARRPDAKYHISCPNWKAAPCVGGGGGLGPPRGPTGGKALALRYDGVGGTRGRAAAG